MKNKVQLYKCLVVLLVIVNSFLGKAQIVSIDKLDTANYTKKAKWGFNFSTGLKFIFIIWSIPKMKISCI